MKPKQQRIAIAEACGWAILEHDLYPDESAHRWIVLGPNNKPSRAFVMGGESFASYLPDYLNDLNAMHEAEKGLTSTEQQNRYYAEVASITWGCEETGDRQVVFNQLTATATQRAEAFLRTLGLWVD